ncbi:MAG: hypothetical protein HY920_05735 [Elusimicrobia bacterium]|nr:hypothetical protein [Elusimicrobiota bacterium]
METKKLALTLLSLVILATLGLSQIAFAATQLFNFRCRTKIIRDGETRYENRSYNYGFQVQVLSDNAGYKSELPLNRRPAVTADPGERYSIVLHNPLPIRVAVNLTIDGINSINGKPGKPADGSKWIIEPYSYITVRGWQVNGQDARRFFFTSKEDSYAQWRSNSWGKDLSVNCGVIGAAYFWDGQELERYYEQNPVYEYTRRTPLSNEMFGCKKDAGSSLNVPALQDSCREKEMKAGTGMGERESNPIQQVYFNYNTGMYKPHQAVIIYYDFAKEPTLPQPFLSLNFAPEM